MYTSGRPPWGGRARASFVECGLILMGTDDKQRKQASSLPGEICLLLAGVQRGPDTRASSHTDTRHVDKSHTAPSEATVIRGCRCNPGGVGRATPERAEGEEQELPNATHGGPCSDRLRASYTHVPWGTDGTVSRRVASRRCNACKSARKETEGRAEEDDRYLPLLRTLSPGPPRRDPATDCASPNYSPSMPACRKASVCSPN